MGYAVPSNVRANSEILKAFPQRTEEEMIRLTGIKERRISREAGTSALGIEASRAALELAPGNGFGTLWVAAAMARLGVDHVANDFGLPQPV